MEIDALLRKLTKTLKVNGIVCGRSVKTKEGEVFVAFQTDSLSPDPGMSGEGGLPFGEGKPLSVKESRAAAYLLAMQTDIAAHEHALASGLIGHQYCKDAFRSIKTRYSSLLVNELKVEGDGRRAEG
ncbi:MAG: hypothetical protein GF334_00605 [Candidatus Altiarchaeales archaeon]|nr:hypothetical protein [Candidatus Altiarchaeales archaeon]